MRTRRTAPTGGSEPRPGVVGALAKGDGHSLRAPPSQDTAQNRRDPRELISVSLTVVDGLFAISSFALQSPPDRFERVGAFLCEPLLYFLLSVRDVLSFLLKGRFERQGLSYPRDAVVD